MTIRYANDQTDKYKSLSCANLQVHTAVGTYTFSINKGCPWLCGIYLLEVKTIIFYQRTPNIILHILIFSGHCLWIYTNTKNKTVFENLIWTSKHTAWNIDFPRESLLGHWVRTILQVFNRNSVSWRFFSTGSSLGGLGSGDLRGKRRKLNILAF